MNFPLAPTLFVIALSIAAVAHGEINFAREIRPILSDHCFACHGPDSNKRKAKLRLDEKESAFAPAKSGAIAIVPGDLENSELLVRVSSPDPDDVMPPPKEHKELKPEQVELLRRWIKEGAVWTGHWAFQPVQPEAVPAVKNGAWARNDIDRFILARLEKEGLAPSPEADRERLLRRVTLDLTGLPPTLSELDAFLADNSPEAYEKAVDRLLASPHFGERIALPWLDLARYGDTSGYHNDSLRDMWLWREEVIKAFNANQPFDQFTIEQLAGDLIPNATIEQKIATGFHRNVMTSDEGGLIEEEYLNLYIVDRVATTGFTWMGMTIACAQCHDHKYDPVTQKDFYQLYAFFANVPENGKDGVRDRNPKPFLSVPNETQTAKLAELDAAKDQAQKQSAELEGQLDARQSAWEKEIAGRTGGKVPEGPQTHFPLDGDGNGTTSDGQTVAGELKGEFTFADGSVAKALRVEKKGWVEFGGKFDFEKDQAFSVGAWLRLKPDGGSPFGKMENAGDIRGWDLEFHGGRPSVHLINHWPEKAIHVQAEQDLPFDTFTHVAFTYDGSGKAAGVTLYVNGLPIKTTTQIDTLEGTIRTQAPFSIGRRGDAGAPFTGRVDDLQIFERALSPIEIAEVSGGNLFQLAALPADQRSDAQKNQLRDFFRGTQATDYLEAKKRSEDLAKEREEFERTIPNTMVMEEMEKPRDTFIKVRGAYDQNGERVTANTPHFLPPLPEHCADGKRYTRLDLARWLVAPENPLTARVAVNRWWAMIFGTGLVKTVNDFGAQGEWPSHPELLDWLAGDFARDWNIKRSIKQMVMSATYRQSSVVSPELRERDGENRLLARGPRHRLEAEFIRDNALAIAGLLNPNVGGPSTKPAQPPGIWEVNDLANGSYEKSKGTDQYRRGLYTYWRRSTVYPSLITFDAPTREVCTGLRPRTSTPLQSLVLMNDPVYVEAARVLAQRILAEGGPDDASRLTFAWRVTLSRPPTAEERGVLEKVLAQQRETFGQSQEAAAALLKVGDAPNPEKVAASEVASWTAVANVLLNLNETISN